MTEISLSTNKKLQDRSIRRKEPWLRDVEYHFDRIKPDLSAGKATNTDV
jgi:hypothetical protein